MSQPVQCAHECIRIFRGAHLRPSTQRPGTVDYHALATAAQLAHCAVTFAAPACADARSHAAEQHAVALHVKAAPDGVDDDAAAEEDAEAEEAAAASRAELVVKWRAALASFAKALPSSAAAAQSGAVGASLAGSRLAATLEQHPAAQAESRRAWALRGGALLADDHLAADDDEGAIMA